MENALQKSMFSRVFNTSAQSDLNMTQKSNLYFLHIIIIIIAEISVVFTLVGLLLHSLHI